MTEPAYPVDTSRNQTSNAGGYSDRPWWRQRWLMLLAGYCISFLTGMSLAAWVIRAGEWHGGMRWERDLMYAAHVQLPGWLDRVMLFLPWVGTNITLIPSVAATVLWLWWKLKRPHLAMRLLVIQIGSYTLNPAMKGLFDRPRPDLFEHRGWYGLAAYPSGHAITSTAVLLTIGLMLREEKGWHWPLYAIAVLGVLNLYSRIYLGVHWPTDVFGGAVVGLVWLAMATLAFREGRRSR